MPTFFWILFLLYLVGNIYIFLRGKRALRAQSTGVKVLLTLVFWGCALSFFVGFLLRDVSLPPSFAQTINQVGTGWLVFTLYMVILLVVFDLLTLFRLKFKYGFYLSLAITLSLLGYGYYHYQHPKTQVVDIVINKVINTPANASSGDPQNPAPGLSKERPLRVVAVSDIHLGYATGKTMLQDYVRLIAAAEPDLILIGGDLIDNSVVPLYKEKMMEELAALKAPLGVYMVPGNHEYISGIEASADFIRQTPVTLLRDTVVTLPNGIQLVGRDDRHNRNRRPLKELTADVDPSRPVILLDHQPFHLAETQAAGIDLQFSGHTHRGQVWPLSLLVDRMFEHAYGYKQMGGSHVYVSSGLSLWGPPFRIGTDSELVVFNLSFSGAS